MAKKREVEIKKNKKKLEPTSTVPMVFPGRREKMLRNDGSFNDEMFFELIGNDIRRKILSKLSKFPRFASDLAIDLGVSKQAIKKHLDKLVEFGIIEISLSQTDQKKQYYQISNQIAIFSKIDLTPNYFSLQCENTPSDLADAMDVLNHDPKTAITSSSRSRMDYTQLNFSLKALGQQLHTVEKEITVIEKKRKEALLQKTVLLNRIQMIINALVENDLEKEVIFSLFFDTKSTVKGITLEEIINQLFLRKKARAGTPKYKYIKTDEKTLQRGQELLELLNLLIKNFGFIQSEGLKLFFDFN
ncbi:ArsR/SmtB family transcription factor [Promethearchaeum syntrophicum]|uniref:ArsR/SmtB family transcription factor n=1 Tax=Promethearchaeum syntrophicum TaxID=2594042 RepID=A0A5B9DAQ2_9ARCH|nr:ArsR family transcriptional regulator [Candidatus Prometheoarchaeum syntrophicum]QEE15850.1 Helix-turn-helix domain protein [Candidatus Prometheoarchaeum syntrophicum]